MTSIPAGGDPTRSQIRGSSILLAGQVFAVIANLAVQVLIVRILSKASFGAFAYALSLVTLGQVIALFGLRRGVSRYMPIYEERRESARVMGTLVFSLATVLTLAMLVLLIFIGFRGALTSSFPSTTEAATVLAIMSALVPLQAVAELLDGVFAVFARPRAIAMRKFVLTPLLRLAVVGLLAAGSGGATALAAGYVATGAIGLAIYVPMLIPILRERHLWEYLKPARLVMPVREVLSFTVPLLSSDVVGALLNTAGAVILGLLATAGDVADLRAVMPVSLTMTYVLSSFGILFVPLASRLYARDDAEGLNQLYWQTAAWTTVLCLPIFLVAVGMSGPLTTLLFGEEYADAAPLLAILAIGHFTTAAMGPNGVVLGVFRRVGIIVAINVGGIVLCAGLMLALVPPFTAVGAALATTLTYVALNVARQVALGRQTAVHALDPSYAAAYGIVALVTAIALPVLLLLSPPVPVGVAIAALAFVVVLVSTRRRLAMAETFPELLRVPILRLLLAPPRSRS